VDDLDDLDEARAVPSGGGRRYWAQRHGEGGGRIDQATANRLFRSLVSGFVERGYFQEWFGYFCIDDHDVAGKAGVDPTAFAWRKTRIEGIWPPSDTWLRWSELELLTAVEFLHDHVSKPTHGRRHDFARCGWHYDRFSPRAGRSEYREETNDFLRDLGDGYELGDDGEVVHAVPTGLEELVTDELPPAASESDSDTLAHAIKKFRARGSSDLDQLDALRTLAGMLESIRPRLKTVFNHKDEADLFELANRFNIRHSRADQQSSYDRAIFLPWLFYSHVAAIHAAFALLDRPTANEN
jgi:hypothetical protein